MGEKGIERLQKRFDDEWHSPLVKIIVTNGLSVNYKAFDNYGRPVARASTLRELKSELIDFFSDDIVFRMI
jgi:hypothetical protein